MLIICNSADLSCVLDINFIIWAQNLVDQFQNFRYDLRPIATPPPNFIEDNFECDAETVKEMQQRIRTLPKQEKQEQFMDLVLSGFKDGMIGKYSHMHDNAIYYLGYNDPVTVELGLMFVTSICGICMG